MVQYTNNHFSPGALTSQSHTHFGSYIVGDLRNGLKYSKVAADGFSAIGPPPNGLIGVSCLFYELGRFC